MCGASVFATAFWGVRFELSDFCVADDVVTEKIQAFATLPSWLQTHTKQPRKTQPEGVHRSASTHREGAHGLSAPSLSGLSLTPPAFLRCATFAGARPSAWRLARGACRGFLVFNRTTWKAHS